jgi:hypothetical protein
VPRCRWSCSLRPHACSPHRPSEATGAAGNVVVGDALNSRLLPYQGTGTLPSEVGGSHLDPSAWSQTGRELAFVPGKGTNSYFAHAAVRMPSWRLRGLPDLSPAVAGGVAILYAGVAISAAALYYATLGVHPIQPAPTPG